MRALVFGRGIAGLAVGRRLALSGWRVSIAGSAARPGRVVTLDPSVVGLLELEYGRDLIRTIPTRRLTGRQLRWKDGPAETIDGDLLVLDLAHLAKAIEATLPGGIEVLAEASDRLDMFDHVFEATGRYERSLLRSGDRTSSLWLMPYPRSDDHAFLGASGQGGWIFAAPAPGGRLFVPLTLPDRRPSTAVVGGAALASKMLEDSPFADAGDLLLQKQPIMVDTTPAFRHPVPDARHLRVGDAAAAGDPLAGDGVGRALRSGVLAAATALEAGTDRSGDARAHYASRISRAHATHLKSCALFYSASRCAGCFVKQIETMRHHGQLLEAFTSRFERSFVLNAVPDVPVLAEMVR
ncbi:MAG: NAD(P)/FAD-dependent oxidoreductase [Geminicoccaceae bacterium]